MTTKLTQKHRKAIQLIAESAIKDGACVSGVNELLNCNSLPEVIDVIKFQRTNWIENHELTREACIKFLQSLEDYWRQGICAEIGGIPATGGDMATVTGGYGATVTGGNMATVTGGDMATVTGGDMATITGGYGATVTGGHDATITGGDDATVTGGDGATVTGGYGATVTGGYGATVTGGRGATITGGDDATITGGDDATITGGDRATVTGGDGATVTGGYRAILCWKYWDCNRYRKHIEYVGENGIKPNTPYKGEFINGKFTVTEVKS